MASSSYNLGLKVGSLIKGTKQLGAKGLHAAQKKTAVNVLNKTQNKVSGENKDILDKARVLVVNKFANGGPANENKIGNIQPFKPIDKMNKMELIDFVKSISPLKSFYPYDIKSGRTQAQKIYNTYLQAKSMKNDETMTSSMAKGGFTSGFNYSIGGL